MSWAATWVHPKKSNPLLLLQRFDVDTHGKDPNVDESTLVGTGTAARGALDLDTFWEGLEREDAADGLSKVTGVARSLEADEIGSEDTME
jgi:hypothetical protein